MPQAAPQQRFSRTILLIFPPVADSWEPYEEGYRSTTTTVGIDTLGKVESLENGDTEGFVCFCRSIGIEMEKNAAF